MQQQLPGDLNDLFLDFSPDETRIVIAGDGRYVLTLADGQEPFYFSAPPASIDLTPTFIPNSVKFSPSGTTLALGDWDRAVHLHSAADGHVVTSFPSTISSPAAAFSADGTLLATSAGDLWRLSDGTRLWSAGSVPVSSDATYAESTVEFSPDGATILLSECEALESSPSPGPSTCVARSRLLRVSDGSMLEDFGTALARRPTFLPDGRILACASILDVTTHAMSKLPVESTVSIYVPGGRIAAGGPDGVIRILCPLP
jgi:WD40 repeat protein